MRLNRVRRPPAGLLVGLIALAVALGGTAYAVHQINGRSIAKRSIPGNRLARHAVGAAEADKASLGLLQGHGQASFGVADAPVSPSAGDCGVNVQRKSIARVRGLGFIDGYCSNYNNGVPICSFSFHNTGGTSLTGVREDVIGGQGLGPYPPYLERVSVPSGGTIDEGTNLPVNRVIWQIGHGGRSPLLLTAVVSEAHPSSGASSCHFQAQALVQRR